MSESRSKENWSHTSALLALLANAHRDPKKSKQYSPADFNPHHTPPKPAAPIFTTSDLSILKTIFVDPHAKK
jgi:hypothetical protein